MTGEPRLTTADLVGQHESDSDRALGRDPDADEPLAALLPADRAGDYRSRWQDLQPRFVDEPRETVVTANALVVELMQEIGSGFDAVRSRLEEQWTRGDDVSTEDLRVALQRYRSFFERLLSV
jgi:hypothetical protein